MPTTMPLSFRRAKSDSSPRLTLAAAVINPDYVVIGMVSVIGLLLAMALAVHWPPSDEWPALSGIVS
jgi:hypothetical protein